MRKYPPISALGALLILGAIIAVAATAPSARRHRGGRPEARVAEQPREGEREGEAGKSEESLAAFLKDHPRNRHAVAAAYAREKIGDAGEASREIRNGPSQEEVTKRAYPRRYVSVRRARVARRAFAAKPRRLTRADFRRGTVPRGTQNPRDFGGASSVRTSWRELGPITPNVATQATTTSDLAPTTQSGRVTAMAIDPSCGQAGHGCRLWVAAAGGGIFRTDDALANPARWASSSRGLTSNSIGSLTVDPNDASGNTLYAGTGEPNGSGDSEAGVGLFKSTDGGDSWSLVPGSPAVADDRSIGSVVIRPGDPNTIWMGTALGRHGQGSVSDGARRTPPGAPTLGLYKSTDGGQSFTLAFSRPGSPNNPAAGSDWFQGGVNKIELDPANPDIVYVALFGNGIWRQAPALEGGVAAFRQVFATRAPANTFGDRTEFDLTRTAGHTRVYAGDSNDDDSPDPTPPNNVSELWRVDNADVAASALSNGTTNAGWTKLSSATGGSPGFTSYQYCQTQCGYDDFVAAQPGTPDTVWLGGSMNYDELFGDAPPRSNGRAVIRSTNAGGTFTDMTQDTGGPPQGMHPDQHAIAFDPANPNIAFVGSDGGVVRTDGTYVDATGDCAGRGLTGTDVADCQRLLSAIPNQILSLNDGLATLQFQSLSVNPADPLGEVLGGTQDNGTWAYTGSPAWLESVGGDGGQSGFDVADPTIRVHSYFGADMDVNFRGNDPAGWDFISDPLDSSGEAVAFYMPLTADPVVGGTIFAGLQHVWRTKDDGGQRDNLDAHCNEFTGDHSIACGDWVSIGADLTDPSLGDKEGTSVAAVERAPGDRTTLWAATRAGRLFVSKNADALAGDVAFQRVDTAAQPARFISSVAIDAADPNHAWVSYNGYNAYTPSTPGHVFEVRFDPASGTATWSDISHDLGDEPVTDLVQDPTDGSLYASTDFGVLRLPASATSWERAGTSLPPVAVYGLTIAPSRHVLYAATHGRGAWRIALPAPPTASIDSPDPIELGQQVTVSSSAEGYDGSTATVRWQLPDGSTPVGAAVSYTPRATGTQTLRATATDQDGRAATVARNVTVVDTAKPGASLRNTRGVTGHAVTITGTVTDKDLLGQVQVFFGDGKRGRAAVRNGRFTVRHVYRKARKYRMHLAAADRAGNVAGANASALIRTAVRLTGLRGRRTGRTFVVTGRVARPAIVRLAVLDRTGKRVHGRVLRVRAAGLFRTTVRLPARTGRVHVTATAERPATGHKA